MADVIRSLSELNILFADNVNNDISPQDMRDLIVSQMVHGEVGTNGQTSITLGTGYQALDFDTAGTFERGVSIDVAAGRIHSVPVDCKALVSVEVMFRGIVGQDYDFTVFKDPLGTPASLPALTRTGFRVLNAAQTIHVSWSAGVGFLAGEDIQAAVRSNTNDFELLFGLLRFQRIGVE